MNKREQIIAEITKETEDRLSKKFGNEIKPNFLLDIKDRVHKLTGPEVLGLYSFDHNPIEPGDNYVETELCNIIVGTHHANTVFLDKKEKYKREVNKQYKEKLAKQVAESHLLRRYTCMLFRNRAVIAGERYAYCPVPYLLFAMCTRMNEILPEHNSTPEILWISLIVNKSLAALTLVEDHFLDTAYMPCRVALEAFVKLMLFRDQPQLYEEAERFRQFEFNRTMHQDYSSEFYDAYDNRIADCNKEQYMHYGFVDLVDGYHEIVGQHPYSINGILDYLERTDSNEENLIYDQLKHLYTICHGYSHGNAIRHRCSLLHYFEISLLLGIIVPNTFSILCEETGADTRINGYDVMQRFKEEYALLVEQFNKRSDELLEIEIKKGYY